MKNEKFDTQCSQEKIQVEELTKRLKKLTEIPSVSGNEEAYGLFLKDLLREFTNDVEIDSVGNVIAKKGYPKTYIFTHMDSIGFLVSSKEDDRVKVVSVKEKGGRPTNDPWDVRILADGKTIEAKLDKADEKGNLYINLPKDKLSRVNIGDSVGLTPNFQIVDQVLIKSQGLDNKLGILAGIEALKQFDNIGLVITVQEETTGIGATNAAWSLKPKAAIVLDTTYDESDQGIKEPIIGGGPSICLKDSLFPDKELVKALIGSAKKLKIPYQFEVLDSGFSDANRIHSVCGHTPFVFLGIPIKNMHSPDELGSIKDVIFTSSLLVDFFRSL
jgi:tetrahedral aminopeptidase